MKYAFGLVVILGMGFASCTVTDSDDETEAGGIHIDLGTISGDGLDNAFELDVLAGENGGAYGKITGTGQPICFVVDADVDFTMAVGLATKYDAPDSESPLGSLRDVECDADASGSAPDFCWIRTVAGIDYVFIAERYYDSDVLTRATLAIVPGPCPQEIDEAVFPYDGEVHGNPAFENDQVLITTLTEGLDNAIEMAFDAEGSDVLGGYSATFVGEGGPVCFVVDSDIDAKILVAAASYLEDPVDSASVGIVDSAHVLCDADASAGEPDYCGIGELTAGTEYIVLAESYHGNSTSMRATLAAVNGPCPNDANQIDEAVFPFDGETAGDPTFLNRQVVIGTVLGTGADHALEATLDPEGTFDSGTPVQGGISATFQASAGTYCFVTDCDLDCMITVGPDASLSENPSSLTVGEIPSSSQNYCSQDASAGEPDMCTLDLSSDTTMRILGESYYHEPAFTRMAVAVFEGDCSNIVENTLTYDNP